MRDLEKLLGKVLPTKVPDRSIRTSDKEIHLLTEGEYLDTDQKVFLKKYEISVGQKVNEEEINKFNIPKIISQYAGIPDQKLENLLFIDTETTGLAGGTGTYAFLIGLGFFEEDRFIIEQLFLTDMDGELKLLEELKKRLVKFRTFVSFNGKSYDVPLLRNRFIFNQLEDATVVFENLDLLHLSRRIWKNSLIDCSLSTIEREILGIIRKQEDDIPGSEIPQEYFYYLETKNAAEMIKVIYHNYYDIFSMVLLLARISDIVVENESLEFLEEIFGLAKLFDDQNEQLKAEQLFLKILNIYPQHKESRKRLSFLYKKNTDLIKASELWIQAADNKEIYACIELAKYNEHVLKDLSAALKYTQDALKLVYGSCYNETQLLADLHHRLERIKGKLSSEA